MNYDPTDHALSSQPRMLEETAALAKIMKRKSKKDLKELMSISDKLASLNKTRFNEFADEHTRDNAKQAILTFSGDVYQGLDANSLDDESLAWAQDHVRILSGLYGVLRPADIIQPYRLEMGTKLKTRKGKDLYSWWGEKITDRIQADLSETGSNVIYNLASNEYFNSLDEDSLDAKVYSAHFLELRDGEYKFISYNAKRSRGWLTRYIIENRIDNPEDTIAFDWHGYSYMPEKSTEQRFVFVRNG